MTQADMTNFLLHFLRARLFRLLAVSTPVPLFFVILIFGGMSVEADAQGTIQYFVAGPETSEAIDASSYPFGVPNGRLQQFYGLQGSSLAPVIEILSVAFRVDGDSFSNLNASYNRLTVTLSTTPATANQINSVFAYNPGPDATVVFDGPITFNAPPSQGPAPFNIVINFTRPYIYNSAFGNLLLDLTHDGKSNLGDLDAMQYPWPSVGGGTDSPGGIGIKASLLVVSKFEYTIVPEPCPIFLFGLCAALLIVRSSREAAFRA
jgi:hypothetical protein